MKRLACVIAALLLLASLAGAATNLNSSKSNYYRMTYSTAIVTPAQAAAILADLDKTPGMDEAKIRRVLTQQGFARHGVDPARVKKILVRPGDRERKSISIIILDKPEDEAAALAVSDEGAPATTAAMGTAEMSPRPMTGGLRAKVTGVDPAAKTFTVAFQDRSITFSAAKLGKLPTVGKTMDIAFTESPGGAPMATSADESTSRPYVGGKRHCTGLPHDPLVTLNVCK